jgi:SAM-dependent methyltransferase
MPDVSAEASPGVSAEGAALARLYDLDLLEDPGDLDLYLALASREAGPVLELAAGTGRLAVPLAEAGHRVTAVDVDAAMLDRLRSRAASALPGDAAGRLEIVHGDLLGLRLSAAGSFGLAFVALNSLFLLATRDAQRDAFRTLATHLAPGGTAAVDVWLPDADDLARFDGRLVLEYERVDPETNEVVTKAAAARHDPTTGVVDLTSIYELSVPGGVVTRWIRRDALRLVTPDELRSFAEDAGLTVEQIGGDYDLAPLGPGSDRAVLIARRP